MMKIIRKSWKVAILYMVVLMLTMVLTNRVEKLENKEDLEKQNQNIVMRSV